MQCMRETRASAHGELMVVRVASLTTVGVDGSIAEGKLWHICRSEDDAVLRTNEGSHSRVLDRGIPCACSNQDDKGYG